MTVAALRLFGDALTFDQYEDKYRLCYMRDPASIIVVLAEEIF